MKRPNLARHWPAIVVLLVTLAASVVADHSPGKFASPEVLAKNPRAGVRYVRDDHDINVYYQRSLYARKPGARPYTDVFSEYPQLATYLFAVPNAYSTSREGYQTAFLLLMALSLGGLAFVTAALCRECGTSPKRVLLLLLPGCLYFTLCRYDVVAALLTSGAVLLLLRGRPTLAFALLGVAFLTKAYPLVLGPLFAGYTLRRHGWRAVLVAGAAFVAVVAVFSLQLAWWAGWEAVLSPFKYQLERVGNNESLFFFVAPLLPGAKVLFLVGQAALAIYFGIRVPRTASGVVLAAAAIVTSFALFTRFHSPQWVLWTVPLILAGARTRAQLALAVAFDLLSYLQYPVAWDNLGPGKPSFTFILGVFNAVRVILLISILAREPPP